MKIGFIGLGNMGSWMAANLLKAGYSMTVYDLKQAAAKPLLDGGASWADTPEKLAEASDIIFTSLPGPKEVEAVALGTNGILAGIRPGGIYIDLSSNSPTLVRQIYARFQEKSAHVMDVPVSGGPSGARLGALTMMAGGDEEIFKKCQPVLSVLGKNIIYTGGIGCGSVCKLMHNCVFYGTQAVVAECLTLGAKAGVDPLPLWQVMRDGAAGQGALFRRALPDTYLQGKFEPPSFALRLAFKDVSLATQLGRELNVPMSVANLALQDMMAAMNRGWGDKDSRITMLIQEERAGGIEVRIPLSKLEEEEARGKK
jgi:3-hydroxyisobutyrate dehydrogenase